MGRPVCAVVDRRRGTSGLDVQLFHDLYARGGGWLRVVTDPAFLAGQLAAALRMTRGDRAFANAKVLVRPHGAELPVHVLLTRNVVAETMAHQPRLVQAPRSPAWARRLLPIAEGAASWLLRASRARRSKGSPPWRIVVAGSVPDIRLHEPVLTALAKDGHEIHALVTSYVAARREDISDVPAVTSQRAVRPRSGVWGFVTRTWRQAAAYVDVTESPSLASARYRSLVDRLLPPAVVTLAEMLGRLPPRRRAALLGLVQRALPTYSNVDNLLGQQRPRRGARLVAA